MMGAWMRLIPLVSLPRWRRLSHPDRTPGWWGSAGAMTRRCSCSTGPRMSVSSGFPSLSPGSIAGSTRMRPRQTSMNGSTRSTCGSWRMSRTASSTVPDVVRSMTTLSSEVPSGRLTTASMLTSSSPGTSVDGCACPWCSGTDCIPRRRSSDVEREGWSGGCWRMRNISNGVPYVGQASVVWDSPRTAVLDHLEVIPGLPATVMLDLVRSATHTAADAGAVTVLSQLDAEGPIAELLRIAGFHRSSQGRMEVDTDFLDEHPDAAEHLHRAALENSGPWGSSRRGRELG